ncbi:MAG: S8 family serine peptidase [Actinomycetota bacterium]|nr:S8 family serine peptidase [Actinomycetota bacterium]
MRHVIVTPSKRTNGSGGVGLDLGTVRSDNRVAAATGRYVVVMSDEVHGDHAAVADALRSMAGVTSIASTRDFEASALDVGQASTADATVFAELGIAVVAADPDQQASITAAADRDRHILAIEPERILYAVNDPTPLSVHCLHSYRDAGTELDEQATGGSGETALQAAPRFADTPGFTWGLQATMVFTSSHTGEGVPVAVLDTGFDFGHPDFTGRDITAQSFVPDELPQDGHGHGTHCVGTSCGPATPSGTRRYGVANQSNIFVGKVLSDQGSGTDTTILAGMSWALANGCRVISMSLGANIRTVSQAYDAVGRRALNAGTLIVAAAGNNARRRADDLGFVGVPANSPSIMAVAAVDSALHIADFSARSAPVAGGQVDIAGPGVAVYSSWPMPDRYRTISGTSMATPHVAGIAALWSEATGATGAALWSAVVQAASRLPLPSVDVGAGLAQAPQ